MNADAVHVLPLTAGAVLALVTVYAARRLPLGGERRFYSVLLAAIAAVYPIAGLLSGAQQEPLVWQGIAALAFIALAVHAWRRQPALVVLGLLAHALWDVGHAAPQTTWMPVWYPALCLAYDLVMTAYAASRLSDWAVLEPA